MIIDTQKAFEDGNQGVTIYYHGGRFIVSVKSDLGGYIIGYGPTPQDGLNDALGLKKTDDFDDLLG